MGSFTTETLFDDLTGEPGDDIRKYIFVLDGIRYSLDACLKTREEIRERFAPIIAVAHAEDLDSTGENTQEIREWARKQGYSISDRGRVPLRVVAAYHEAVR